MVVYGSPARIVKKRNELKCASGIRKTNPYR